MKTTTSTRLRKYWKASFGLATFVLLCVGTVFAQTTYTVTDLGTLGGTFSLAGSMDNRGQVVGYSSLQGGTPVHAFLWQKGTMTDLGTLGGPNSLAVAPLAQRGEVAGLSETSTPDPLGEDFCGFGGSVAN
jgi:probable HAF family extracellular repeat protein